MAQADIPASRYLCKGYYRNAWCEQSNRCLFEHIYKHSCNVHLQKIIDADVGWTYGLQGCIAIAVSEDDQHFADPNARSKQQTEACRFFLRGNCRKGQHCHFLHATPRASAASSSSSSSLSAASASSDTGRNENAAASVVEANASSNEAAGEQMFTSANEEWVNAPEFIPKTVSQSKYPLTSNSVADDVPTVVDEQTDMLCPIAEANGACNLAAGECKYLHGDICDTCGCAILHPKNMELRNRHVQECLERQQEMNSAIERSREKTCGICFDIISEMSGRAQRFGILPNCNHCFCLTCIRQWRQATQFESKLIRSCPECRITSDFVCPSIFWVDTKEEKDKIINEYKSVLSRKDCKYFRRGRGECPFGNKCFYRHALPDGTIQDVGPPQRRRANQEQPQEELWHQIMLWDFLDERENRWLYSLADDIDDLVSFFSDSDDSEWSTDCDFVYDQ